MTAPLPTAAITPSPSAAVSEEAVLVLEDGTVLRGLAYGARGVTFGEAVFTTGMTGYQETLTDPSYHRQIVVMTSPHIGNTGVNDEDPESGRIWVSGFVVRDAARRASNWRAIGSLDDDLVRQGVVGIRDVDTRFLTRHLRDRGVMRAGIFSGEALVNGGGRKLDDDELLEKVLASPSMVGAYLADEVSVTEVQTIEPTGGVEPQATVVAVDLGLKMMTPQRLADRGVRVHVVPHDVTFEQVLALLPDDGSPRGVFFSNGPGDPAAATGAIELLRQVLDAGIPVFGICFGNQLLGRALGFGTYKLTYGHRGVNQPVMDRATGKVEITAHNHGFAVDAPLHGATVAPYKADWGRVVVSHVSLNDDVVEGLTCLDIPAFSVQYHPEAAAGPHDSSYLFDRFVEMMRTGAPVTLPADVVTGKENN